MPVVESTRPMWLRVIDGTPWLVYIVNNGDTLSDIAARFTGDPQNYHHIASVSGIEKPDHITPGQLIKIRSVSAEEFKTMTYAMELALTSGKIRSIQSFMKDVIFGEVPVRYVNSILQVGDYDQ